MTDMPSGRSHGKIILFGEHAVVHGVPALVCGISRQLRAYATPATSGPTTLQLLQRHTDAVDPEELGRALAALLAVALPPQSLALRVEGELPPGVGLGFSASAAVALARAVESSFGSAGDEARVVERANAWEGVFHGNPSGVDVAAAMHGGCLRYVRGEQPLPIEMGGGLWLVVGQTGTRSSTRAMVARVAEHLAQRPEDGAARLRAIGQLVERARGHIEAGSIAEVGPLMDENQRQLAAFGLSTDTIDRMGQIARDAGALGCKLTGAGGGGSVIALVRDEAQVERVEQAWRQAGFQALTTQVGPA